MVPPTQRWRDRKLGRQAVSKAEFEIRPAEGGFRVFARVSWGSNPGTAAGGLATAEVFTTKEAARRWIKEQFPGATIR